jgi:hypothetical protein
VESEVQLKHLPPYRSDTQSGLADEELARNKATSDNPMLILMN